VTPRYCGVSVQICGAAAVSGHVVWWLGPPTPGTTTLSSPHQQHVEAKCRKQCVDQIFVLSVLFSMPLVLKCCCCRRSLSHYTTWQVVHTHVPLWPSSIISYKSQGSDGDHRSEATQSRFGHMSQTSVVYPPTNWMPKEGTLACHIHSTMRFVTLYLLQYEHTVSVHCRGYSPRWSIRWSF